MVAPRLVALFLVASVTTSQAATCVDLIPSCANLQSICIGSILEYHYNVISGISEQVSSSSIPALESSLPNATTSATSALPLVLGTNNESGTSTEASVLDDETLKNALPLLKESLPLLRESLPLIRESLPLIRDYLSPLVGSSDCLRKATCRSCKDCPKLRLSIIKFVESLCPSTCKVCTTADNANTTATGLSSFFA